MFFKKIFKTSNSIELPKEKLEATILNSVHKVLKNDIKTYPLLRENEYLHLKYNFRGEPRDYKVQLVKKPSNLGIGEMWFFKCPQTGMLCRKLYSIGGYFFHREAFKGYYYESQLRSKNYRDLEKQYKGYFSLDRYYEELYSKNFKKTYRGKPTKRYLKLLEKIEKAEKTEPPPKNF